MASHDERFMELALEEARKAEAEGNPPFGSVVVRDGVCVARGHNLSRTTLDVTAHAETVALRNTGPALGTLEFPGATLYTTFEPCPMCLGAIMAARVSRLVLGGRMNRGATMYGAYSVESFLELAQWSSRLAFVTGVLQERCETMVADWRRRQGLR